MIELNYNWILIEERYESDIAGGRGRVSDWLIGYYYGMGMNMELGMGIKVYLSQIKLNWVVTGGG